MSEGQATEFCRCDFLHLDADGRDPFTGKVWRCDRRHCPQVICWSCHERQPVGKRRYVTCFECSHMYTRLGLVLADWRLRRSIAAPLRFQRPRSWRRIYVCPCCAHDF